MRNSNGLRELRNNLKDVQVALTGNPQFSPEEVAAFYPVIEIINKIIYNNPEIPDLTPEEIDILGEQGKLYAVKHVKDRVECSLILALDAVNRHVNQD